MSHQPTERLDPVRFEVFAHRLWAIAGLLAVPPPLRGSGRCQRLHATEPVGTAWQCEAAHVTG